MTIDYRDFAYPKKVAQVVERARKKAAAAKEERDAKAAVWKRANRRCERCGRMVTKNGDSLTRGEVHHKTMRSNGGTWALENLIVLCAYCHAGAHNRRVS